MDYLGNKYICKETLLGNVDTPFALCSDYWVSHKAAGVSPVMHWFHEVE